jgi:elongation factor G
MKTYNPQDILNIAVAGHGGEGKTTLCEAFLFNSGATERMGRVEDGNTVTDYDPEETKRQFSIGLALAPVEWTKKKINLIDVPGYFDFAGESVAAYALCDSALIVLSPKDTVPVGAEKAYDYCEKHTIPRAFVINQIDKENADYIQTVDALKAKYAPAVTPLQLPILEGGKFTGVVDIISQKAVLFDGKEADIPAGLAAAAETLREELVENAAGNDEALMEKYFDGQELTKEDILSGLKAGILQGTIAPVFAAAAASNLGVKILMNELANLMPAAADLPARPAKDKAGKETEVKRDSAAPFAAQVIKSIADPFVGRISIIKVFSGKLTADMAVHNANSDKNEKASNLGVMRGKKMINVGELVAGDIGALAKLQATTTGDTLCASSNPVEFEKLVFPEPCISFAVTAKKQGDEEKVFSGLHKFEEEDPSFKVSSNAETGDTLVSGMGEMHLEVILNKLKNKFGAEGQLNEPRVPYRETIKKAAEAEGKHKKQSGGAGQFGVVFIRFEPIFDGSAEFEFVNKIVGGVVPKEFIPAVEKGLKESMQHGVLAGYPMVNVRATLFDGKYHPVDSKEVAFKSAARLAYKAACAKADPVILEPICKVEVTIPDEYMGDVIGDLNRRRGRILGMNPTDGLQVVEAETPMSEMTKYATDLRSMTQARGSFKLTFERYEELPAQMAAKVVEQAKRDAEEEK